MKSLTDVPPWGARFFAGVLPNARTTAWAVSLPVLFLLDWLAIQAR